MENGSDRPGLGCPEDPGRDGGGAAPGRGDAGPTVPVVMPQHAATERFGFQPHLGAVRPQADAVPEDRHPAQAWLDRGTVSHDPFGDKRFWIFIPVALLVRAAEQDSVTVREHVRDPGWFLVPVDEE